MRSVRRRRFGRVTIELEVDPYCVEISFGIRRAWAASFLFMHREPPAGYYD